MHAVCDKWRCLVEGLYFLQCADQADHGGGGGAHRPNGEAVSVAVGWLVHVGPVYKHLRHVVGHVEKDDAEGALVLL